jgi:ABC-type branched-subunit amino acid transport system ATPase component
VLRNALTSKLDVSQAAVLDSRRDRPDSARFTGPSPFWRRYLTAAELLSGSQRQMLALAPVIISRPRCCSSTSLRPGWRDKVSSAVCEMCASGMAVLIAEESCRWLDGVAKRSIVPKTGRVVEIEGCPA